MPRLVNVHELAALLGVSEETIYKWHNQRKIAAYKLPGGQVRFPVDEIMQTLRKDPTEESVA